MRPGCKQTYSSSALQGSFREGHRRQSRQGRPLVASEMGGNTLSFEYSTFGVQVPGERPPLVKRSPDGPKGPIVYELPALMGDEPGRAGHPLEPDWGLTTLGFEYLVFRDGPP